MDLLNIVLNKDVAEGNQTDFQVAEIINSEEGEAEKSSEKKSEKGSPTVIVLLSGKPISTHNMTELEKELSKKLNAFQTNRALRLFSGFQSETTHKETEDALVN